jgi:uncharacterized protein (DUF2164 family)
MNITTLFSYIPDGFFSIVNGKYKQLYIELLQEIYGLYQDSISLMDKDILIDLFCDVVEQQKLLLEDDEELLDFKTSREKANYFFRKLRDAKWVIEEQMMDYTWKVAVPDYALTMLYTFERITSGYQEEYRGRILSVYQHLHGEGKESYISLKQAYENTTMIVTGLKQLNYSIKQHTEKLLEQTDVYDVLHEFFFDFEEKILGTYYYRLKSSDHVSKYRVKILEAIQNWQFDHKRILNQSEQLLIDQVFKELHQAENQIFSWLDTIEKSFNQMDELLNEIDNRVKLYTRAAEQRIKFYIRNTSGVEEKVNDILIDISHKIQETSPTKIVNQVINNLLPLYRQRFLDEKSWKLPYQAKPKQKPSEVDNTKVDGVEKKNKINKMIQKSKQGKTVEQINQYLYSKSNGKREIPIEELPLTTDDDWLSLIYALIFTESKKSIYGLSKRENEERVKHQGITVPKRSFVRKEK